LARRGQQRRRPPPRSRRPSRNWARRPSCGRSGAPLSGVRRRSDGRLPQGPPQRLATVAALAARLRNRCADRARHGNRSIPSIPLAGWGRQTLTSESDAGKNGALRKRGRDSARRRAVFRERAGGGRRVRETCDRNRDGQIEQPRRLPSACRTVPGPARWGPFRRVCRG
jgi:hypothetical protein